MSRNNPTPRRSKLEIYFCVLDTIQSGAHKPTHIMYGTNLNYTILKNYYLPVLLSSSLIIKKEGEITITDKGREWLRKFRELDSILNTNLEE